MTAITESSTASATQLDCIGQITLTVNDLAESKHFYQEILGMKFLFDAGTMAFFQVGTVRLLLGLAEKPTTPEGTILYFRVADILATAGALKQKGVIFEQEPHLVARMPDHDLWMAFLKDPAGNVLGLMSEISRNAV